MEIITLIVIIVNSVEMLSKMLKL